MHPTGDVAPQKPNAKPKENPNIPPPKGFETAADFLAHARKLYHDDRDYDKDNRDAAVEDAEFVIGQQWDTLVKFRREFRKRPALTVNRTLAFVAQVVGARLVNQTQIKVLPEFNGSKEVALTRQGIIRNSERKSKANRAYDTALQCAVIGGLGNFGIELDYARYDVFEQDINWLEYPDPFSVTWDRLSVDMTGRDANHVFVEDRLTREEYDAKFPWARPADLIHDQEMYVDEWFDADDVRIASFWRLLHRPATVAMMSDGDIVDITDWEADDPRLENVMVNPKTDEPYIRETKRPYAEKYVISGTDILDGPYSVDISRVPVFRVPAWEITINGKRHRFGLVRFLKDPQRLHNYWRSVIAEKLIMAPRARWVASDTAVAGKETAWREAHLSDDPLLIFNAEAGQPPVFTPPVPLEVSLINEANMSAQDMRDVSNLHEAYMGKQSNEVSGDALEARQRMGDVGTTIYHAHLNESIGESGEVANEFIPIAFDNARTVRIEGDDGTTVTQRINDPTDPDSIDIGIGLYSIAILAGPSTATKRVEAQKSMQTIFNAAPETFAQAADLWVDTMDFPGAPRLAKRLRGMIDPRLLDPEELDPREREQYEQRLAQQQQQADLQAKAAIAQLQAELMEQQAKARKAEAEALKAEAEAMLAVAKAESEGVRRDLMGAQADKSKVDALSGLNEIALNPEKETKDDKGSN